MEIIMDKTNNNSKIKVFRLGELFCGPGGLAYGAINANYESNNTIWKISHEWASDYDLDSCNTYIRNICPHQPQSVICKDVKDLDINALSPIDGFAYGFPCNDFSIVGEKKGFEGEYGPLYSYGIKIINKFKPKFFVAENVGGLASSGNALSTIINDLQIAGNGYDLTVNTYKSEEYGVPQSRHRIIIVGIDQTLGVTYEIPKPTHKNNYISCKKALEIPPIPENAYNNEYTRQSKQVVERLKYIQPGQNAWNAKIPEHLRLNVKATKLSQIYKRLDPNKPSYTITGSGGGGTHVYHWSEPRALTNRERARLQSFPDDFVFEGSKESVRRQIGMAVPPKLSKIIFKQILISFSNSQVNSSIIQKQNVKTKISSFV